MNLISLKPGMLIRDDKKLLEVTKVMENSATAKVLLDDLEPVEVRGYQITYSAQGIWSFIKSPTDKQLSVLEAVRNEQVGVAAVLAALAGGGAAQSIDGELQCGDRVSWIRDRSFRVQGVFWKNVRDYCICVSMVTKQRVALKPEQLQRECQLPAPCEA